MVFKREFVVSNKMIIDPEEIQNKFFQSIL